MDATPFLAVLGLAAVALLIEWMRWRPRGPPLD